MYSYFSGNEDDFSEELFFGAHLMYTFCQILNGENERNRNTRQHSSKIQAMEKFSTNKMAGFCLSYCEKPSSYDFCVIFYECWKCYPEIYRNVFVLIYAPSKYISNTCATLGQLNCLTDFYSQFPLIIQISLVPEFLGKTVSSGSQKHLFSLYS